MTTNKSYQELVQLKTYEERLKYLHLGGKIGDETFGIDRYLNQRFYRGRDWTDVRRRIIVRDNGCDMGLPDYVILGKIIVHHINPLTIQDILDGTELLLDENNLISVSEFTHRQITYGPKNVTQKLLSGVRRPNDTTPWKKGIE